MARGTTAIGDGSQGPGRAGNPWKGAESYQAEDRHLFFGREADGQRLRAKILSSRLSVLHAPSGAGKTSILNTLVIPDLERAGLLVVRARLQDQPIDSVRVATLESLLPPPSAERAALRRVLAAYRETGGSSRPTLLDLRDWFRGLLEDGGPELDPRSLIGEIRVADSTPGSLLRQFGRVTPWFTRWLRGNVGLSRYGEHLRTVSPWFDGEGPELSLETPCDELEEALADRRLGSDYEELLDWLALPLPDLHRFFSHIGDVYAERSAHTELILIVDQFEELFTRFVDPGPVARARASEIELPDWRLRTAFIEELENLLRPSLVGESLSIRVVLSMRDDYIAHLDPIRRFAPDLDANSYHLSFLGLERAEEAICSPAAVYRQPFDDECYELIKRQLAREDQFIEPAHIQIVCGRLWEKRPAGGTIPLSALTSEKEEGSPLTETESILEGYFGRFLDRLIEDLGEMGARSPSTPRERRLVECLQAILEVDAADEEDGRAAGSVDSDTLLRAEILETLEPLITAQGTRNIVSREDLVGARYRHSVLRDAILELLRDRVVRIERRLGGWFVEIMHEFLIGAVDRAIRHRLLGTEYRRLREAIERFDAARVDGVSTLRAQERSPLTAEDLRVLRLHEARLDLGQLSPELFLESAILEETRPEEVRSWCRTYQRRKEPDDERLSTELRREISVVLRDNRRALSEPEWVELRRFRELSDRLRDENTAIGQLRAALSGGDVGARRHLPFLIERIQSHGS